MSPFTAREVDYLSHGGRLARIATVGPDGTPHVVPVGWSFDPRLDAIEIGGFRLEQTKKYRDVLATGRAAVVIDDLESVEPWLPRGVEIRGAAEAVPGPPAVIRIYPERIVSWGIESQRIGDRYSRAVH